MRSNREYLPIDSFSRTTYRESPCTPSASTTNLRKIAENRENRLVAQRHKDDAVMRQSRHCSNDRRFLATTHGTSADEDTRVLAPVAAFLPDPSGLVPEGFPLGWEVTIASWDAKDEGVVFLKSGWVAEDGDALVLGWSVHLLQYFFRESLLDLVEVAFAASLFDAFGFRLGEGLDMAPSGVLQR